jgi:hypothetical protein
MENLSVQILPWNLYKRIAFRFVFIFFILFIVLLDWSVNPVFSYFYFEGNLAEILDWIITGLGKYIFRIPYTIISPYDGQHNDRTYIYLLYFAMGLTATIGTILWSIVDRKRINYETAYYWLTAIVRYYLAFTLFLFALEKFFKMQFPDLELYTLTEPVGNLSPMSLAWAFFGYSDSYNIFIGIAESAALLLLFRRTMIFGAILTLGTLLNVMLVNFSYDVHAKMYPTVLWAMTFFLLLPYLNRFIKFFFTHQVTSLPPIPSPVFKNRWMTISKNVFKFLLIGGFTIFSVKDYFVNNQRRNNQEMSTSQAEISGIFDVTNFVINKDTLAEESLQWWNQIVIGGSRGRIRLQGDSVAYLFVSVDNQELLVYKSQQHLSANEQEIFNEYGFSQSISLGVDSILIARQVMSKFQFALTDTATLVLNGTIDHNPVSIKAKKRPVEVKDFRLTKNGFHWVTE